MNIFTLLAVTKINPNEVGVPKVTADDSFVDGLLSVVYISAGIALVVVIIVCGILYSISQGEAAKIQRAKNGILYAVIGIVIIMSAFVITNFIIGEF